MGLDWCLRQKIKADKKELYEELDAKLTALSDADKEDTDEYRALQEQASACVICAGETLGAPRVGIDQKATDFFKERAYDPRYADVQKEKAKRDKIKAEIAELTAKLPATPTTLVSEAAFEEARIAKRLAELADSLKYGVNERYIEHWDRPFEELLKEEHGKYVIELTEYSKSTCVGAILVTAVDFRGKCVGYCEAISEKLQNEAYEDHTPEQSVAYAKRLMKSACGGLREHSKLSKLKDDQIVALYDELSAERQKISEAGRSKLTDAQKTEVEFGIASVPDVESWYNALPEYKQKVLSAWAAFDAARWLMFWGERGHGYHAWY